MPNLNLPTNITPGVTATFEADVEAAWKELNLLSGDTEWINVTSMLLNGWTASEVFVRRIRGWVYWEFVNLDGTNATNATLMNLTSLTGFTPPTGAATESPQFRGVTGTGYIRFASGQAASVMGFAFAANTRITFNYRTTTPWPTTLPGA